VQKDGTLPLGEDLVRRRARPGKNATEEATKVNRGFNSIRKKKKKNESRKSEKLRRMPWVGYPNPTRKTKGAADTLGGDGDQKATHSPSPTEEGLTKTACYSKETKNDWWERLRGKKCLDLELTVGKIPHSVEYGEGTKRKNRKLVGRGYDIGRNGERNPAKQIGQILRTRKVPRLRGESADKKDN